MLKHRPLSPSRSGSRRQRALLRTKQRLYRGMRVESLEDRIAPAVQYFSGLEFMTSGAFSVNNNVVTSSSPVEVGVSPASSASFAPLVLLQSGVEFNSTDATGTFTTPPSGATGGAVSAYAGGSTVPLLDTHSHTFEAPALLSSSYDVLPTTDVNSANLGVAGGDLSVTALRFNGAELDVQGNLSFQDFSGLTLAVGNTNDVALSSSGVSLSGLSVSISGPTKFTEAGLAFTASNLQVSYSSTNNTFDLSGSANLAAANTTFDLTLGSASSPGLVIQNGALASLDASVTSDITIAKQTFTINNMTLQATAGSNVTVTGTVSFGVDVAGTTETIDLNLGTTGSGAQPGLVIDQATGALVSFDAAVNTNLTVAGFQITAKDLTIAYQSASQDFEVSGTASFALGGSNVDIMLGNGTTTNPGGLFISGGSLTMLEATLDSNIDVAGMSINTNGLTVDYNATNDDLVVTGTTTFTLASSKIGITLGDAKGPGLVMQGGSVTSFDATLNADITVAGLTITTTGLTVDYSADSLIVTGQASFTLAGSSVTIMLGDAKGPGLVMQGGSVQDLDASITSSIVIAGLTITTNQLGIQYASASSGNTLVISGSASFAAAGATVDIALGDNSASDPGGIVITGGSLTQLDASITGMFDMLGITFQANDLTFEYQASGSFEVYGGVSISSSFLDFSTQLGNEQTPGITIQGTTLETLNIAVSGGFNLFGFDVQANGLSISYAQSTSELEISGGIMIDFTNVFEVSAAITQGGLFINTSTGALSLPSTGLQITASATLGPFSIQDLMISFSEGSGGVNFSASGDVQLPGGFGVDLTQLVVQNGQLVDIGVAEDSRIPIGDTGFFLDSLSGSLENLNNISQLQVSASASLTFGPGINIPSMGPFFAGASNAALVSATGSITVSASQLDLTGSVSLMAGLLGQGSASLDLDWATGVYMVSGDFSMYDGVFNFGGSMTFTSAGDITLLAMASVNVPPQVPFIGGDSLGSINFFLQYEPGQPLTQDVAAAWTTFSILSYSFTIGFEVDFQGDLSIVNGNNVAGFIAAASPANQPSVYQNTFSVPTGPQSSGAVPTIEQIAVSSPILDGAYPTTPETANNVSSPDFGAVENFAYADFSLPQSDVILSTLTFTLTVTTTSGVVDLGNGSFNSNGQFVFTPNGTQAVVPTSATLDANGLLQLDFAGGVPITWESSSISANYDVAGAYFELDQLSSSGASTLVADYSIDPVTNSPNNLPQPAASVDLVASASAVPGVFGNTDQSNVVTKYTLAAGPAVPQTVSFTVYQGSTLLGSGYFDAAGYLHFLPNGDPPIQPVSGLLGVYPDGEGYLSLSWPSSPNGTAINVQYATPANRVIEMPIPSGSSSSSSSNSTQYVIKLISDSPLPADQQPMFSEQTLYQAPTVSFAPGSVALSPTGVLSGTLLANAYTPNAQLSYDTSTTVSLYYSTDNEATNGTLISTYDYSAFTNNGSSSPRSYQFSWPGLVNLPAGSYYLYAIINDGQNQPVMTSSVGPFDEASPTPLLSGPSYLPLASVSGIETGVFSTGTNTALGVSTNFTTPVTVSLGVTNGNLVLGTAAPASSIVATYPSAAAAVAALNGLIFQADGTFSNTATLTYTVNTSENGVSYTASESIPLLTPNTPIVVYQSVDTTIPSSPNEFNLTVTAVNQPNQPDGQDATGVQVLDALSPGLSVVSWSASQGSFDPSTGIWSVGDLPTTGANSSTLTLVLQAAESTQGSTMTSSVEASSDLYVYPASNATNVTAIRRPHPITITVSNLNDDGPGSLRASLAAAENGDTIRFAPGLAGTIALTSGELLVNQDVSLIGPTNATGGPAIVISGSQASRVFDIEGGTAGVDVTIQNLVIENGSAISSSPNVASAGGGLLVNDAGGSVTLTNVLISGNNAQGSMTTPAQGGGVAFLGGTGVFANDTFSSNDALAAVGGESLGGAIALAAGNLSLLTSTVAGNSAVGGQGGGVDASGGVLTLSGDTLADNTAGQGGDVSQTTPALVEAVNSLFASSSTTATAPDFSGTVAFSDHNLVDNTSGASGFSSANGDVLNVAADLAPLGNHGGPLETMPPLPGSPAINAGDSGVLTAETIPNLAAFWQGNGNANDATGANDATLAGGATYGPGDGGTTAFALNGTSSYVQTAPNPANLSIESNFSVSAIVNPTALTNDSVIIDKTEGSNQVNYRFGLYGNGTLYFWNGTSAVFSNGSVPTNTFSQVGFTLSSNGVLNFYINGQLDSTQNIDFGAMNNAPVWLGHDPNGGYFQGTIQDVAVYNRILTPAQMNLLASPSTATQTGGPTGIPGLVSLIGVQGGSVQDLTGSNSPTASSSVTYGPGIVGQAIEFDGTSAVVSIADNPALDTPAFSIGGWFNVASAPATGAVAILASKSDNAGSGWTLEINSNLTPIFTPTSPNNVVVPATSTVPLALNTWYYIAATFDGTNATLYIDGALVATAPLATGYATTPQPLVLGASSTPSGDSFDGAIDNFAFFNVALTSFQVRSLEVSGSIGAATTQTGGPTSVPGLVSLIGVQGGSAQDLTGANAPTANSSVTYGPGIVGQAIEFNGTSAAVSIADNPSLDTPAFSIGGWFNVASAPATGAVAVLAGKSDNAGSGWTLEINSDLMPSFTLASPSSTAVSATSTVPLSLNTWYYIAATFDGANATLYINGAPVATSYLSTGYATTSQPFVLGASSSPSGDYFSGAIDDFAFYNVALTTAQVGALSVTAASGDQAPFTSGLADFYAAQGNTLDNVGSNNGTISQGVGYTPGVVGQAFNFNGNGSYIDLGTGPDIVGTGAFAVAAWVNTSTTGTEFILNQRDPNNYNGEYVLALVNGQINFWVYGNSQYDVNLTTNKTVNDGQWHLIVAQRQADGAGQIYVDGVLAASGTGTPVPLIGGVHVYIGEDVRDAVDVGPSSTNNYMGALEGVQIYNTALTPGQISNLQTSLGQQITATTDQRGLPRLTQGGLDIGAVEYQYDLSLTGSAPSSVPASGVVEYTLTATNNGPDSVAGATLTDTLPLGVDFQSISVPAGWTVYAPAVGQAGLVTVTVSDGSSFPSGGVAQFTLTGSVMSAALNNTYIDNTAVIGPSIAEATPLDSSLTLVTDVPNGLGLLSQPATATIGRPLSPALVFNVVDNSNNTVVTDNTQLVTLAIASGPAGAILSGTTTVRVVDGVATFTNVSVNMAGTYVLVAVGGDLTPIDTNPIEVAPVAIGRGIAIHREPLHEIRRIRHGRARTELALERIVIDKTSRHAWKGPIGIQVDGLAPGETLANASGINDGSPYRDVVISGKALAPHRERVVNLDFTISGIRERGLQRIYKNIELFLGL